jgi:hypothetical protein
MTVSGHADLDLADIVTGRTAKLGALAHRPAVRGVARGDETTTYVAVGIQHGSTAIVAVEFEIPAVDVVARSFAASDSGDLAGYRAEVVRLAERHVSPSGRSDVELQEFYNDMQRLVYDQLGKPVGDRVQALGLELSQEQTRRSVDGGWPPDTAAARAALAGDGQAVREHGWKRRSVLAIGHGRRRGWTTPSSH